MQIQPLEESRIDEVVVLSLRAWEPVFESIRDEMDPEVFRHFHPDWRASQRDAVEAACKDDDVPVWIAAEDGRVAGFVAVKTVPEEALGEIYMIAVDPDFQRRGIATALTDRALEWFRGEGIEVVMVETGGDPGHAPARRAYESAGFRRFPVARYFKKL